MVAVADLNIERAEAVCEEIAAAGGSAITLQADVSNRFQTANMIERMRDAFGRIDILVNAGAAFRAEPLLAIDEWDWRRQLEVNLTGVFFSLQLVARVMADDGGGRIINLIPSQAMHASIAEGTGFIAGMSGVIGLTRQAARELAPHNIRVNAIAYGNIHEHHSLPVVEDVSAVGRAGTPDDIADAVSFLCCRAADFITGQVIVVDGGRSLLA